MDGDAYGAKTDKEMPNRRCRGTPRLTRCIQLEASYEPMGAAVPRSAADLRSQVTLGKVRVGSFWTGPRRAELLAIANRRLSRWKLPQGPTRDRLQTLQGATGH